MVALGFMSEKGSMGFHYLIITGSRVFIGRSVLWQFDLFILVIWLDDMFVPLNFLQTFCLLNFLQKGEIIPALLKSDREEKSLIPVDPPVGWQLLP